MRPVRINAEPDRGKPESSAPQKLIFLIPLCGKLRDCAITLDNYGKFSAVPAKLVGCRLVRKIKPSDSDSEKFSHGRHLCGGQARLSFVSVDILLFTQQLQLFKQGDRFKC